MKNFTIDYISLSGTFNNTEVQMSPVILKGATTLSISLTGIPEDDFKVNQVTIDWGKGDSKPEVYTRDLFFNYRTQPIFNEVLYGKIGGSVLGIYSYDYINEYNTYEVKYTINILLQKSNGKYLSIKQPLRCLWGSFYDSLERLTILNTQILPVSSNDTFLNLNAKSGAVYIGTLKTTGIPLLSGGNQSIEPLT